ncbi:MAG TPA: hypothetical protein VIV12_23280 [Streptosporangiaceae bacterium]
MRLVLGSYGGGVYRRYSPLLLLWRIRHHFRGPANGCSCSDCFFHPKRRVMNNEVIHDRLRISELENRLWCLEHAGESRP